jgi:hypothetical protein
MKHQNQNIFITSRISLESIFLACSEAARSLNMEEFSRSGLEFYLHPVCVSTTSLWDLRILFLTLFSPPPRCHSMQLVLLNISDHFIRNKVQGSATSAYGCILGSGTGREVEISNSFEVALASSGKEVDSIILAKRVEQCESAAAPFSPPRKPCSTLNLPSKLADKQTFPTLDVLGWYATSRQEHPLDLDLHRQVGPICISNIFYQPRY